MTNEPEPLFTDAQPADDVETNVTQTVAFSDGKVLLGTDPFEPIAATQVPADTRIVDNAIERY